MSRLYKFISIAMLCLAVAAPQVDARGRNNAPGAPSQNAPAAPQDRNHQSRPGNQGNNGPQRPGNNNPGNNRPGNQGPQRPGDNRPGNQGNHGGHNYGPGPGAPGHNNGPGPGAPGHNYGPGPGHNPGPGNHFGNVPPRPPYRPHMPAAGPMRPPVAPPGFRPYHGCPTIGSILGIALGTAINMSLNYLITNGYSVAGYSDQVVYLNNVNQLNLFWPNATLYYSNRGALMGSEFVYSTPYYDMNRYNTAFRYLCNAYGAPVQSTPLPAGGVQASWFGYDGAYVTLQYHPANAYDGSYRYFTTLSFGR